jgi:hypothetical protein
MLITAVGGVRAGTGRLCLNQTIIDLMATPANLQTPSKRNDTANNQ